MVPLQLFFAVFPIATVMASEETACEERCTRLKQRSLMRVGYDEERLQTLFDRQRPLESMKDVCWRLYDNIDCMKKCPKSEKHQLFSKTVRNKCKFVLQDMEHHLKCVSKHQSFLKTRCSSFINEASRLRAGSDLSTTPHHEQCRFLHLNTICLENHVNTFCPDAKKIFRRLNFRDYFLSFVLPKDDDLFDDEDLDSCQIYDFVKDAGKNEIDEAEQKKEEERRRRIEDDEDYEEELTTIVNDLEEVDEPFLITTSIPIEAETTSADETTTIYFPEKVDDEAPSTTVASKEKEEFSSLIQDLIDSPEQENKNSTSTKSNELINNDNELDHVYDEEDEYTDDNSTHPTISVVAIETRSSSSSSDEETSTPSKTTETTATSRSNNHQSDNEDRLENEVRIETTTLQNEQDLTTFSIHLTPPVKNLENFDAKKEKDDISEELEDTTKAGIVTTTPKRKVFSEDSMEETPPNFMYSSNRGSRYDTTTRSNYVADNMDKKESQEALEIDTSTLFGVEDEVSDGQDRMESGIMKKQENQDEDENDGGSITFVLKPTATVATQRHDEQNGETPWLQGGVVVKPILKYNQADIDEKESRELEHRKQQQRQQELHNNRMNRLLNDEFFNNSTDTIPEEDVNDDDTSDKLILIGLIALVTCLIFTVFLILIACFCSSRSSTYNVQKNGSP